MSAQAATAAVADPPARAPHRWTYRPGLDGLRALAVLAVVVYHYNGNYLPGGYLGVTVFFVLSGYLITGMLATEHSVSGRIDLGAFYARRALRLYPALVVAVAATIIAAFAIGERAGVFGAAAYSLLYVNDFVVAAGHASGWLAVTWSLGVEEQFYLLWPLLMLVALRVLPSRTVALLCLAAAVELGLLEAVLVPRISPGVMYFSPLGNIMALMLGAGVALLPQASRRLGGPLAVVAAAALAALALRSPGLGTTSSWRGPEQLATVAAAAVIAYLAGGGFALLRSRIAVWIGRRSYGIYLIHESIHTALSSRIHHANEVAAIGVPLSIAFAALSYRLIEQPFLRLKRRFART
jgi:peptidoglycan/LPS O-acetylase OafA/YrhL